MSGEPIPAGKLPVALLEELLAEFDLPDEVVLGPAVGEDAAAIRVDTGLLVAATDPITLTGSEVGSYAVTINANDVAVLGVRPRWFLAVVLLPPGTTADAVRALFADMRAALQRVGAALVGGHTEVTSAVAQPVVVGQMLGLAEDGRIVRTGGARPGDLVVQVGRVPVEGAAVLADGHRGRLEGVADDVVAAAIAAVDDPGISIVAAALRCAELGATALHDPTEGGLAAGLHELARASGVALTIDVAAVAWFEPGVAVCEALGADPLATLASGCLVATFPSEVTEEACSDLRATGHPAVVIGAVDAGEGVRERSGDEMAWPDRDEVARLSSR